jgi:hypothetical protein
VNVSQLKLKGEKFDNNNNNTGYEEHTTKTKISHLPSMDDLKLIAKSEEKLQKQIQTVTTFSDDIHIPPPRPRWYHHLVVVEGLVSSSNPES